MPIVSGGKQNEWLTQEHHIGEGRQALVQADLGSQVHQEEQEWRKRLHPARWLLVYCLILPLKDVVDVTIVPFLLSMLLSTQTFNGMKAMNTSKAATGNCICYCAAAVALTTSRTGKSMSRAKHHTKHTMQLSQHKRLTTVLTKRYGDTRSCSFRHPCHAKDFHVDTFPSRHCIGNSVSIINRSTADVPEALPQS